MQMGRAFLWLISFLHNTSLLLVHHVVIQTNVVDAELAPLGPHHVLPVPAALPRPFPPHHLHVKLPALDDGLGPQVLSPLRHLRLLARRRTRLDA